ncbi:MAG: ATP-binding cassette domain-containing protein [Nitrospinae bacterium]|nr:ATP-binding cassette domain-containing protein [Nitrospinota bacterium]
MGAIEVEGVTKKFGEFVAVDAVSFSVREGEVFGLLGPNGAGKSTLIRMLTTLIPITSGRARVSGHDVIREPDQVRGSIGVIPQAMTSDPDLTAEENLNIYAKLYRVSRRKRRKLIEGLLEAVQLIEWRHKLVKTFSGGMRRRLEIARGLIHSPSVIFLDEPTTGLDPASRVAVWGMIEKLKSENSLTILLTTHYMEEADQLCERIAIIDQGRLVALDTPEQLKASISGGSNPLDVRFVGELPPLLPDRLKGLAHVSSVMPKGDLYRILTDDVSRTMMDVVELARVLGLSLMGLKTEEITLDDVFLHYTGRALRDAALTSPKMDVSYLYK